MKEEFQAWKRDLTTQKVFSLLEDERKAAVKILSEGNTLMPDAGRTAVETARFVGIIFAIDSILDMEVQ